MVIVDGKSTEPVPWKPVTPPQLSWSVTSSAGNAEKITTGSPFLAIGALNDRATQYPFGMPDAAVEPPAAVDPKAVALALRAGRKERDRRRRDLPSLNTRSIPAGVQECAERRNAGRADHGAPAAGQVVIGEIFEHQHFGDRVGLCASHLGAELQPEHPGIAQRLTASGASVPCSSLCGPDARNVSQSCRPSRAAPRAWLRVPWETP